MAQNIDEAKYESMISALSTFITQVSEACDDMEDAGKQCVENMDGDEASTRSNDKLAGCIAKYRETLEEAQGLINKMQQELENAREAAAKVEEM